MIHTRNPRSLISGNLTAVFFRLPGRFASIVPFTDLRFEGKRDPPIWKYTDQPCHSPRRG